MSEVTLLAKSIEIDSQQKTIVQLSDSLARITIESRDLHTAFRQSQEDHLKRTDELSAANVALILEKNESEAARGRQQQRIQEMEDDLTELRSEKERHEIINRFIFAELKDGIGKIDLPYISKTRKGMKVSDRKLDATNFTYDGLITHIDDFYQELDNAQLRKVLKE